MNKIFSIFFFLCFVFSVQSQNFSSQKLSEMGDLFPKNCLPKKDSIFDCPQVLQGKSLVVNYNAKNEVSHLGVSLFSPETKQIINPLVCNFLERMMLELLLLKTQKKILNTLKYNNIDIRKNGVKYGQGSFTSIADELNRLQNAVNFRLTKGSVYSVDWEESDNRNSFTVTFPISRELIFGTDKKESDQNIGDLFENTEDCFLSVKKESISAEELTPLEGTDLYVKKGNIFLKNSISSDVYYKRSDNKYQLFFDADFPELALVNMFITRQFNKNITLKIKQRMYGGFTPEFSVSLNKFFCIFDKGFDTYCIVPFPQQDNIKISVVLHNRDFDYIHLLRIKTTTGNIFSEKGILEADLYTNIPKHNLTNLFSN